MLNFRNRRVARRLVVGALSTLLAGAGASHAAPPMTVVTDFDVTRYLGTWHQVAAIPAWFQSECVANTTATYTEAEDGLIGVVNACDEADGTRRVADARARFVEGATVGKLEVTFVELFGLWLWPIAGDYWIIGLDPEYRWAVVGAPSRKYAWVLARTPTLESACRAPSGSGMA